MAMTHWLVDETGEIWQAHSEELHTQLGFAPRPTVARANFLVTNLGYISVEVRAHGIAIRWRPTFVRRESLAAAILLLADQTDQRVVISALGHDWTNCLSPSIDQATNELLDQFAVEQCAHGSHFVAHRRRLESLPSRSLVGRALGAACDAGLRFEPGSLWDMLDRTVDGRYLLVDPDRRRRRLRIMAHGRGYALLSRHWTLKAGLRFRGPTRHRLCQAGGSSLLGRQR